MQTCLVHFCFHRRIRSHFRAKASHLFLSQYLIKAALIFKHRIRRKNMTRLIKKLCSQKSCDLLVRTCRVASEKKLVQGAGGVWQSSHAFFASSLYFLGDFLNSSWGSSRRLDRTCAGYPESRKLTASHRGVVDFGWIWVKEHFNYFPDKTAREGGFSPPRMQHLSDKLLFVRLFVRDGLLWLNNNFFFVVFNHTQTKYC